MKHKPRMRNVGKLLWECRGGGVVAVGLGIRQAYEEWCRISREPLRSRLDRSMAIADKGSPSSKKPIVELLFDVIAEAESQNQAIDFIELSKDEWKELRATSGLAYSNSLGCMNMRRATFSGVTLKLKQGAE